jgi:hypothetical protein
MLSAPLRQAELATTLFQHVVIKIPAEPTLGVLEKRLFSVEMSKKIEKKREN